MNKILLLVLYLLSHLSYGETINCTGYNVLDKCSYIFIDSFKSAVVHCTYVDTMSDIIIPLQNFTNECDQFEFQLVIEQSPIEALSGEVLENISIVSLQIIDMENLNYVDMKIFSASYKTLIGFYIVGCSRNCGTNIVKDLILFSNLEIVMLEDTEIELVPEGTFYQNLNSIYLSNSRVGFLDNYAFQLPICDYCSGGISFSLINCSLYDSSIAKNAFANIDINAYLSMEENYLTKLDEKTFRPLLEKNPVNNIYLEGNPLICDCLMQWTLESGTNFVTQLPGANCDDGRLLSNHSYEELANCRNISTTTEGIQSTTFKIPTTPKSELDLSPEVIAAISAASVVTVGVVGLICYKFTCLKYFKMVLPLCCCGKWSCINCKNKTTKIIGVKGKGNTVTAEKFVVTGVNITHGIPSSS